MALAAQRVGGRRVELPRTVSFWVLGTVLVLLLFTGALSDHLGRRPVILAALGVEVAALVMFIVAGGVASLFIERILQGVATGGGDRGGDPRAST